MRRRPTRSVVWWSQWDLNPCFSHGYGFANPFSILNRCIEYFDGRDLNMQTNDVLWDFKT
jgi:hypothetical protein